jgi:hypothetical protein
MRAFFAEDDAFKRDAIAVRQLRALEKYRVLDGFLNRCAPCATLPTTLFRFHRARRGESDVRRLWPA